MADDLPDAPTNLAEALLIVAEWLDLYDRMGVAYLDLAAEVASDAQVSESARALVPNLEGKEVQNDLRAWAEQIEALIAQARLVKRLGARVGQRETCFCGPGWPDRDCPVHFKGNQFETAKIRLAEMAMEVLAP